MNDDEMLATARASLTRTLRSLDGVHMERPVTAVVARARTRRLRRGLSTGAAAGAVLAVTLALTAGQPAPAPGPHRPGTPPAGPRAVAYVINRVEKALTGEDLVFYGQTKSNGGPGPTWAYGRQNRTEEFSQGQLYWVRGTALIHGRLTGVYVTYFDHEWSLLPGSPPASACSEEGALSMGGPPVATSHWSDFIHQTLACGAASVTGHVRIGGMETTKITGRPFTARLKPDLAALVHEKWMRARWVLYVSPKTYLPVRMVGSTETFGGSGGHTLFQAVTRVHWLRPTRANIAKTLVTIPPGFRQVRSPGSQQP